MIAVRDSACGETNRVAGSRGSAACSRQVSGAGRPRHLYGLDALHGMVQTAGQAARSPKSDSGTLKRHCTAFGNVPAAVSALLKPLTAATKTLTGSKTGKHVNMGERGK